MSGNKKMKRVERKDLRVKGAPKTQRPLPQRVRSGYKLTSSDLVLSVCRGHTTTLPRVEVKEFMPEVKGTDAPAAIVPKALGYKLGPATDLTLGTALSRLFMDKVYKFRLATVLTMSSSGAGSVNSTLAVNAIGSNPDFVALSTVFNEFFVVCMDVKWVPVSHYNYPLTGVPATSVSSLPIGCAQLQHGQTPYTSTALASNNYDFSLKSTGDPWSYRWVNIEKSSQGIVDNGVPTQSWCVASDFSQYSGLLQFIAPSAPPGLPASQVLGNFLVEWELLFRVRA